MAGQRIAVEGRRLVLLPLPEARHSSGAGSGPTLDRTLGIQVPAPSLARLRLDLEADLHRGKSCRLGLERVVLTLQFGPLRQLGHCFTPDVLRFRSPTG